MINIEGIIKRKDIGYNFEVKLEHGPAGDRRTFKLGGHTSSLADAQQQLEGTELWLTELARKADIKPSEGETCQT